ncbi:TetR family transcriptional regulator [Sphingomonas sp. Leaf407]|nr:TetR family transcriptional regulator [Sphingomonas sp. Leaf42]KQT27362.1 TetR family transcriptional regulator [Sphingomonas sp. Leaf407]
MRTIGSNGPQTLAAIRAKGLELLARHGYEAMSLRMLAQAVGIQPGSLYNHIDTKQGLLFDVVEGHLRDLIAACDAALDGVTGARARLERFAAFHVEHHITRQQAVFVGNSELRALTPANHAIVAGLRGEYEARLIDILAQGAGDGSLRIGDVRVTAYALLGLLTGVCTWFRPGGRLDSAEVVALHVDLAVRSVT